VKLTFLVPCGAEAAAVRSVQEHGRIIPVPAGAASAADLPAFDADERVVVLGLCGALRARTVGDVVIYRDVATSADTFAPDAALTDALAAALPNAQRVRACSADHVVTRRAERAAYAGRYDADVVDMEGAVLAPELARRNVRYAMVRVVSDDARRDLPALDGAIRPDGGLDVVRLAAAFVRDPHGAWLFARDAQRALRVLAACARELTSRPD
jgi:nucleoside phosphorylase